MKGFQGIHNVRIYDGSETVEVNIIEWNGHEENGVGLLADGTEVSVFVSYDGDGYLVLSDQDADLYLIREQEGQ